MAVVEISESIVQGTADAIREMTGDEGPIKPVNFPDMIRSIETGPSVESIVINDKSKTAFQPGDTANYSVTISPAIAKQEYTVSSSNESVATVVQNADKTFTITAVDDGTMTEDDERHATITVKAGRRDPKTDSIAITVKLVTIQPVDPSNVDHANSYKIIAAGEAENYFPKGMELQIPYSGNKVMPMIVEKYVDITLDGNVVKAPYLRAKYCAEGTTAYHTTNGSNMKYSTSTARTYLLNTIMPKFDAAFVASLATNYTVKQITYGGATDSVTDKMWLPSANEMGSQQGGSYNAASQYAIEGERFNSFSSLNSDGSNNSRKIMAIDATGTAQYVWLRSSNLSYSGNQVFVNTDGSVYYNLYDYACRVLPACVYIGKSA